MLAHWIEEFLQAFLTITITTTKKRCFHRIKCPKKNIITSTKFIIHVYISIGDMQAGCNYKNERPLNNSNSAFCPNIHLVLKTIVNWLCNSILLDNTFLYQHTTNRFGMSVLSIRFVVSKIQISIFNKILWFWIQLFLTKQYFLKFSSVATQFNTTGLSKSGNGITCEVSYVK